VNNQADLLSSKPEDNFGRSFGVFAFIYLVGAVIFDKMPQATAVVIPVAVLMLCEYVAHKRDDERLRLWLQGAIPGTLGIGVTLLLLA